jgi:hypothetical protein
MQAQTYQQESANANISISASSSHDAVLEEFRIDVLPAASWLDACKIGIAVIRSIIHLAKINSHTVHDVV